MTPLRSLVAAIALLVLPLDALATELDQFMAKVAKSAPHGVDVTPPVTCVCKTNNDLSNKAGQLQALTNFTLNTGLAVLVRCHVLIFDSGTEELVNNPACDDWVLLPK